MADVPGRCEPGTGEINYRGIALALKAMGYRGPVAMEAFAAGDSDAAVEAFRNPPSPSDLKRDPTPQAEIGGPTVRREQITLSD